LVGPWGPTGRIAWSCSLARVPLKLALLRVYLTYFTKVKAQHNKIGEILRSIYLGLDLFLNNLTEQSY